MQPEGCLVYIGNNYLISALRNEIKSVKIIQQSHFRELFQTVQYHESLHYG